MITAVRSLTTFSLLYLVLSYVSNMCHPQASALIVVRIIEVYVVEIYLKSLSTETMKLQ